MHRPPPSWSTLCLHSCVFLINFSCLSANDNAGFNRARNQVLLPFKSVEQRCLNVDGVLEHAVKLKFQMIADLDKRSATIGREPDGQLFFSYKKKWHTLYVSDG